MTTAPVFKSATLNDSNEPADDKTPAAPVIGMLATITTDLATAAANATISGNATALATVTTCQTDVTALSATLGYGSDIVLGINLANANITASKVRRWVEKTLGSLGLRS